MSESVKILIEAEDQATPTIVKSAKAVDGLDASLKKIKESGGQAKKSADFAKALASSLGGSQIGGFIAQLGEAVDKTAQFAEIQKTGGAGALAFKAGLVAMAGALAFQVGNAIGNVIFQTEKWTRKLAEANAEAKRLSGLSLGKQKEIFSDNKEDAGIILDPEQKRKKYKALLDDLKKNLVGVEADVSKGRKEVEAWNDAWFKTGNRAAFADQAKEKLVVDKERLQTMQDQRSEIEKILSDRTAENALLAKSQPIMKSLSDELGLIEATQADIAQKSIFVGKEAALDSLRQELHLLESKQAINALEESFEKQNLGTYKDEAVELAMQVEIAKKRAEITKEQVAQETKSLTYLDSLSKQLGTLEAQKADANRPKKIFVGVNAEVDSLKEEIRLIEQKKNLAVIGEKAGANTFGAEDQAKAESLLLQIDLETKKADLQKAEEASAVRIAQIREAELAKIGEQTILLTKGKAAAYAFGLEQQGLGKAEAAKFAKLQEKEPDKPVLQATESRLLTRGSGEDPTKQVAANTALAVEELRTLNKAMLESAKRFTTLKVVGGGI